MDPDVWSKVGDQECKQILVKLKELDERRGLSIGNQKRLVFAIEVMTERVDLIKDVGKEEEEEEGFDEI